MKRISYQIQIGKEPDVQLMNKSILCSDDALETNQSAALDEAFDGKITVIDEPTVPSVSENYSARLSALEQSMLHIIMTISDGPINADFIHIQYLLGRLTQDQVKALTPGRITADQAEEIVGGTP